MDYLDPDHAGYTGLPPDIVAERLSDPEFLETLEEFFPVEEWVVTVQVNVTFTQYCRDILAVYEAWTGDRESPEAPTLVLPNRVADQERFDMGVDGIVAASADAIDSGDPSALRDQLMMNGGCNVVIASPDSPATIEELLAQD